MDAVAPRVLLVEDEPLIAMELEALVAEAGFEPIGPAASCDAAFELIEARKVDAAIIDYILGDDVSDALAAELCDRRIPWALTTGFDPAILSGRFQTVPLIAKPFAEEEVRAVLAELLSDRTA